MPRAHFLALLYLCNMQPNQQCLSLTVRSKPLTKPSWCSRARTEKPCKDQSRLRSIQVPELQGEMKEERPPTPTAISNPPPPPLYISPVTPLLRTRSPRGLTVLHWKHLGSGRKVRTYTCGLANNSASDNRVSLRPNVPQHPERLNHDSNVLRSHCFSSYLQI